MRSLIPYRVKKFFRTLFDKSGEGGWSGNYSSWKEAQSQCSGYDSTNILDKVMEAVLKVKKGEAVAERDSVLFDKIEYSQPLLEAFEKIAKENNGRLHLIDFGGSLGSSYFQFRNLLKEVKELDWKVVEQRHFVEAGNRYIAEGPLSFWFSIDEAIKAGSPDVLFASSVIQYFEKPYELIAEMCSKGIQYIIIDRTAFIEGKNDRITVQVVPEEIYKASYPAWFFNEQRFVDAFSSNYRLVTEFDSIFDPKERLDSLLTYRKGFVFKKR